MDPFPTFFSQFREGNCLRSEEGHVFLLQYRHSLKLFLYMYHGWSNMYMCFQTY